MINCLGRPPQKKTLREKIELWWWRLRTRLRWLLMMFPWWDWSKVKLPTIKKTFPTIDAKTFVETQPMTGQHGLVVQMKVKYGQKK